MSESTAALSREASKPLRGLGLVREGAVTVVEVAGVVAAAATIRDAWFVSAIVLLAPLLIAVTTVDARTHRIPNALTLTALAVCVTTLGAHAFTQPDVAVGGVTAAVTVGLLYLSLWRLADLGLSDVKPAATLGLGAGWSGWQTVAAFVVLAHLLQVPFAVWRLARRRRERMAFAPALVVGLYAAVAVTALTR